MPGYAGRTYTVGTGLERLSVPPRLGAEQQAEPAHPKGDAFRLCASRELRLEVGDDGRSFDGLVHGLTVRLDDEDRRLVVALDGVHGVVVDEVARAVDDEKVPK